MAAFDRPLFYCCTRGLPATVAAWAILVLVLCCSASVRGADQSTQPNTIEVDGRTRTFLVHLPPAYDGKSKLPLVLMLHGSTQPPEGAETMSGLSAIADRENLIAVYPAGVQRPSDRGPRWNSDDRHRTEADDVAFLRRLILHLQRNYHADEKRIYIAGMSNGAMMAYRMACEASDLVAAVAPVGGAQGVRCQPKAPVSVIVFHGTDDDQVPFSSTYTHAGRRRINSYPVADSVTFWVKHNGCPSRPARKKLGSVEIEDYSNCNQGTAVGLFAIQSGGHVWPGGPNGIPASEIIWKFFSLHPKQ